MQDNGLGIKEEDQARIFDRDTRVEENSRMNSEGLGMGLSICKTIVAQYDGSIEVTSEGITKGSTFTFCMAMKLA